MIEPPLHPQEELRLEVLARCGVLDTPPEPDFDHIAMLAAAIAGTPIALVSLVDRTRQWFKAHHGLEASETARSDAFCAHAILDADRPLVVPNAALDPRFIGNPLVEGEPHVAFYVGVPLLVGEEHMPLGTLCVIDHTPRAIDPRVVEQLRLLARQTELLLELRERQRALENRLIAVETEEERVSSLFTSMGEGVVVQEADGRIVSCNRAAEQILGLSADAMMGRTSLDPRWHATHADGTPFPGEEHPAMRALATGLPVRGVVMGVGTDGMDRRWILINAQPMEFDEDGRPRAVIASFSDVTDLRREEAERQKAERQVESFFTVSLDLLCVASIDGRFLRLNPAFTRVLGWPESELTGRPFLDFVHPDDVAETIRVTRHLATSGHIVRNFQNRYRTSDGRYRTFSWSTASDGELLLAAARDVTDELAREEELVQAKNAAEAAVRAKSDFLATMSHEIRTPMNGVIGLTDVLLATSLSDSQREMLRTIRASGGALLAILNDVLDWSRIEAGRLPIESTPVDPQAVLHDVVTVIGPEAAHKGLALEVDPGPAGYLQGDAGRIRQVLFNLLGNAVKFTPRGRVRASFELLAASDTYPRGAGRFVITDTGIGIPAERMPLLFHRFSQGDTSTTRRFGGSGLGLAISQQLAVLMGGRIDVTSTEHEGSTFSVVLPLAASAPAVIAPRAPLALGRSLRVLLAEDN